VSRHQSTQQAMCAYCSVRGRQQYRLSAEAQIRTELQAEAAGNGVRVDAQQQDFELNI
jgi:hypothetical protein